MQIGVITWFHYENYGTVLQALALQKYLEVKGYESELIDFPIIDFGGRRDKISFNNLLPKIKNKIVFKFLNVKYKQKHYNRSKKFKDTIYKNCNVSNYVKNHLEFVNLANQFDLLICGSDQIWNPNGYVDYVFANYPQIIPPKIAYAPSLGVKQIPDYYVGTYFNTLKSFSSLSVRERNAQKDIVTTLGLPCSLVVDPVLLLDSTEWRKIISKENTNKEKYVLCYFLTDNAKHWKAAEKFARSKKLKLKIITMTINSYIHSGEKVIDAGPEEFFNYIDNAAYVITDSFHASVFSIILHKNFYVFERTDPNDSVSQNSRIYNLLNESNLNDRLVKYNSRTIVEKHNINFNNVKRQMKKMIDDSKNYLINSIEKETKQCKR